MFEVDADLVSSAVHRSGIHGAGWRAGRRTGPAGAPSAGAGADLVSSAVHRSGIHGAGWLCAMWPRCGEQAVQVVVDDSLSLLDRGVVAEDASA